MTEHTALMRAYLERVVDLLGRIEAEEAPAIARAAELVADQAGRDRLIYVYGPGGHSNLAAQEVFFRAGGLVNVSAILDEGTLLSGGALRSMAMERTPGYGTLVIEDNRIGEGDLLILVNAYGINSALIDAALTARSNGALVIGVSSREHADATAPGHPARHPSKHNLHDIVDEHIDTKVPIGDAVLDIEGVGERVGAISTFANAYALNCLMAAAITTLAERGAAPDVWRSGNAPGGDESNALFLHRFRGRVRWL
ncbi:sugar isomerase domain-containing protein [Streptosporangium sp. KLBMP 9127]|nr:sugar isomerase domain-containing protein [Streptosporangium sp. KLBMP 9127]